MEWGQVFDESEKEGGVWLINYEGKQVRWSSLFTLFSGGGDGGRRRLIYMVGHGKEGTRVGR
jgi:hypothetical protein